MRRVTSSEELQEILNPTRTERTITLPDGRVITVIEDRNILRAKIEMEKRNVARFLERAEQHQMLVDAYQDVLDDLEGGSA